jgi:hypothetical protein
MPVIVGKRHRIVKSLAGNNGKIVTVLGQQNEPAPFFSYFPNEKLYTITPALPSSHGYLIDDAAESQLELIDDDDINQVIGWKEMENIWTPEKVSA